MKSPGTVTSLAPTDSFFDSTNLAWVFVRYECQVRLLMLSMRSSLYSLNVVVSLASAAQSAVSH